MLGTRRFRQHLRTRSDVAAAGRRRLIIGKDSGRRKEREKQEFQETKRDAHSCMLIGSLR